MPRFAANVTMMFTEEPFLARFAAAAAAGFRAVECLFPYAETPAEVAKAVTQHHLTLALFNLPPGDWEAGERGLAALPGRFDDFCAALDCALPYVAATGVKRVHMMAALAAADDRAAMAAYERALAEACMRLAPLGVDVMIEPINSRDMPGYFLNDFNMAAAIIRRMNLANLKLQFDIYHRQIIHGDVMRGLAELMPLIGHMQVASVPSRHEPDGEELNFPAIFAEIDRLGYQGFIGCEYRPRAGTLAGLGWMQPYHAPSAGM